MVFSSLPAASTAVLVGASRGIGLAVAKALLEQPQIKELVTVSRHGNSPVGQALAADISTDTGRRRLAETMAGRPCHLLINTVGLLHNPTLQPEKRLEELSEQNLMASHQVNAFAPALTVAALWPSLKLAGQGLICHFSARVGSISDNHLGGWYSYRAAKASQNQLNRTLAIELGRRLPAMYLLTFHPGTTDTKLSEPFQARVPPAKLFTPTFVAERLLALLAKAGPQHHGGFWDWDAKAIGW